MARCGATGSAPAGGEPTRGLAYARMIRPSPARMAPAEVPHLGVEGEIAFRFTRDFPARDQPYTREEIAAAVAARADIIVSGDSDLLSMAYHQGIDILSAAMAVEQIGSYDARSKT